MSREHSHFAEPFTRDFFRLFLVDRFIFQKTTRYQTAHCIHNRLFGKVLFLDRRIQSAQVDEFVFHEALVHPALFTHPSPKKILIMGGAEGATLREVLKHHSVEKAVMVDIDRELVELCREHLPEWADGAFSDPRARISIQNARSFINGSKQKYDIMISDLTEPLRTSPSLPLYTQDFFREVRAALKEDGIFAVTAGSCDPYYSRFFSSCVKTLESVFRCVRPFWTFIFSFGLPWGFILAADRADPAGLSEKEILRRSRLRKVRRLRFYHPLLHKSLFSLPIYLLQSIRSARILTDKRPFIWEA